MADDDEDDGGDVRAFIEGLVQVLQERVLRELGPGLTFLARGNAYGALMAFGATAPDDPKVTWLAVLATRDMAGLLRTTVAELQKGGAAAARRAGVSHIDTQTTEAGEIPPL